MHTHEHTHMHMLTGPAPEGDTPHPGHTYTGAHSLMGSRTRCTHVMQHTHGPLKNTPGPLARDKPTVATRTSDHWDLKPLLGHWAVTTRTSLEPGERQGALARQGQEADQIWQLSQTPLRVHEFVRGSHSADGSHWESWRPYSKPSASPVKGGSVCPGLSTSPACTSLTPASPKKPQP